MQSFHFHNVEMPHPDSTICDLWIPLDWVRLVYQLVSDRRNISKTEYLDLEINLQDFQIFDIHKAYECEARILKPSNT